MPKPLPSNPEALRVLYDAITKYLDYYNPLLRDLAQVWPSGNPDPTFDDAIEAADGNATKLVIIRRIAKKTEEWKPDPEPFEQYVEPPTDHVEWCKSTSGLMLPMRIEVRALPARLGRLREGRLWDTVVQVEMVRELRRRIFEAMSERAAETRPLPAPNPIRVRDEQTETRDRYIYDECLAGVAYGTIKRAVNLVMAWAQVDTEEGIRQAALRYADRHTLPTPPRRNRGRRRPTQGR